MEVLFERCAGIDIHKRTAVVCLVTPGERGQPQRQTRTFGTTTPELLALSDWLSAEGCTHVGIESTGEYWKPVFNLLEGSFEVWLLNARHVKAVPGRKTDVGDAQWLAELLRHGLVRPSFIPPRHQRELRDLTRHRTNFVRERVTLVNRVQKVLEGANIKLAAVATNIMGVSGRAMLAAILAGEEDGEALARLAKGRLRHKRDELERALTGRVRPHHRFLLAELLAQIDGLEETIARFDEQIARACAANDEEEVVALLDTIPGVGRETAERLVAELGADMTRFPSAHHLAAWAGLAPGNNQSGGRQRSGRTRRGNTWLRTALIQAAHAAARTKGTYLAAQYQRLAARRGAKRAIVAVAHSLLVIAYHLIARREPYRELGADYFDRQRPAAAARRLVQRLRKLGFAVTFEAQDRGTPSAAATPVFSG
jgi:transposase